VQRKNLSGFARLRAILWQRSLRLTEAWYLGRYGWYWRLRRHLARAFSTVDLHSTGRLENQGDIFGETPVLTLTKLLEVASALEPEHPRRFVDLGSGRGLLPLAASFLGYEAYGFEKEADWVGRAQTVAKNLGASVRFEAQDFLEVELPTPALFFTVGTAFPPQFKEELLQVFSGLGAESLIITGDWELPASFEGLWEGRLPVDWGVITFRVYRAPTM